MKLTERRLRKIIWEELNEVFSPKQEKEIVRKLISYIESSGLNVNDSDYCRGLFEVGPSGFRVVVEEVKDGVNRPETGLIVKFPSLQSEQGVEKRTIWAEDLKTLVKKFIKYYKEFDNEYDVNDEQFEDWIDVQVQQSQGNVQRAMNMSSL